MPAGSWLLLILVGATAALNAFSPSVYGARTGKVYWSDYGTEKIQRADLVGTNVEDVVATAGTRV